MRSARPASKRRPYCSRPTPPSRHNPARAATLQLFWKTAGEPNFSDSKSARVPITNDGGWREIIDVRAHAKWCGTITQLRIDPVDYGDGHAVGIDYVRFR